MTTKELGNLGEKLACEYLVEKGFNILGKNWRITLGELDVIARKKFLFFTHGPIHFVEVKTIVAHQKEYRPEAHVDYRKQHKLRQLSQIWLKKHRLPQNHPHQIDVIGILIHPISQEPTIHFFENAVGG